MKAGVLLVVAVVVVIAGAAGGVLGDSITSGINVTATPFQQVFYQQADCSGAVVSVLLGQSSSCVSSNGCSFAAADSTGSNVVCGVKLPSDVTAGGTYVNVSTYTDATGCSSDSWQMSQLYTAGVCWGDTVNFFRIYECDSNGVPTMYTCLDAGCTQCPLSSSVTACNEGQLMSCVNYAIVNASSLLHPSLLLALAAVAAVVLSSV